MQITRNRLRDSDDPARRSTPPGSGNGRRPGNTPPRGPLRPKRRCRCRCRCHCHCHCHCRCNRWNRWNRCGSTSGAPARKTPRSRPASGERPGMLPTVESRTIRVLGSSFRFCRGYGTSELRMNRDYQGQGIGGKVNGKSNVGGRGKDCRSCCLESVCLAGTAAAVPILLHEPPKLLRVPLVLKLNNTQFYNQRTVQVVHFCFCVLKK
mmetsp:Transcript_6878/g.17241  ORF Transcript_6878/g.17241 Transcript_6878/m.17241 type:complete len:208 (-) Transcript_6878:124-747(-)